MRTTVTTYEYNSDGLESARTVERNYMSEDGVMCRETTRTESEYNADLYLVRTTESIVYREVEAIIVPVEA